jgi:hypothetical protein
MPRQPLGEISSNSNYKGGVTGRFELTPNWRAQVQGRINAGQTAKVIFKETGINASTITITHRRSSTRYENESVHRSGRPKLITESLSRRLLRIIRSNPKIIYRDLRIQLGLLTKSVSKATLYREIKAHGIINWIAKKRPFLSPEVVAKRLK